MSDLNLRLRITSDSSQARADASELTRSIAGVRNTLLGLMGIGATTELIKGVVDLSDEYTNLQSRIKLVTESQAELEQTKADLITLANDTRQSLSSTVNLYSTIEPMLEKSGKSHAEILQVVESVNKSLVIGGSTTAGASASILQLSQALGSGVLRGEEFNSIMENGRGIAMALADALHTDVGKLRQLAEQGKLTSDVVVAALTEQGDAIDKKYAKIDVTIGQAVQVVKNNAIVAMGAINEATGASAFLAQSLLGAANSIDYFAQHLELAAAPAAALAIWAGAKGVTALTGFASSLTTTASAARLLSSSLLLIGGPIGALALAVGAAVAYRQELAELFTVTGQAEAATRLHQNAMEQAKKVSYEYADASDAVRKKLDSQAEAARNAARATVDEAKAALESARIKLLAAQGRANQVKDSSDPESVAYGNTDVAQREFTQANQHYEQQKKALEELEKRYALLGKNKEELNALYAEEAKQADTAKNSTDNYTDSQRQAASANQKTALELLNQTDAFKKQQDAAKRNGDALKQLVESLTEQRLALVEGEQAAQYYTDRLSGLNRAEAEAAAGARGYNAYLAERKKLQSDAASAEGGLRTQYLASLEQKGIAVQNSFDVAEKAATEAIRANDEYKKSLSSIADTANQVGTAVANAFNQASGGIQRNAYELQRANAKTSTDLGTVTTQVRDVVAAFEKLGWTREQAIGITANLKQESNFNARAVGDSGRAYGIAQWHPDRQANFAQQFGHSIKSSTLEDQIKFVDYELRRGTEAAAGRLLAAAKSANEAASIVSKKYERPADREGEALKRAGIANQIQTALQGASVAATQLNSQVANVATSVQNTVIKTAEYKGKIDAARLTEKERNDLADAFMKNQADAIVKKAQQHNAELTMTNRGYRELELINKEFNATQTTGILNAETSAAQTAEHIKLREEEAQTAANGNQRVLYELELEKQGWFSKSEIVELSNQKMQIAFDQTQQGLIKQNTALKQNQQEQFIAAQKALGFNDTQVAIAASLNYTNLKLAESKKLATEQANVKLNPIQQYAKALQDEQGLSPKDAGILAAQKQQLEFEKVTKELDKQTVALKQNQLQQFATTLANNGLSDAQVKAATAIQYTNTKLAESKKLATELANVKLNPIQQYAKALQDEQGLSAKDAGILAAQKQQVEFAQTRKELEKQNAALKQNQQEQFIAAQKAAGFSAAQVAIAASLNYANTKLAESKKLATELANVKLNPIQQYAKALQDEQGLSAKDAGILAAKKQQVEFEKVTKELDKQTVALKQNQLQQFATTQANNGLSKEQVKAATAIQYTNTKLAESKKLATELANVKLNPIQQYAKALQDEQGLSAKDAGILAAKKQQIEFAKTKIELEKQTTALKQNAAQQFATAQAATGLNSTQTAQLSAIQRTNALQTEKNKLLAEAQRISAKGNQRTLYEQELRQSGFLSEADIKKLSAKKMDLQFKEQTQELARQRQEILLGANAYRQLALEAQGYSEVQARSIVIQESANKKLSELKAIGSDVYNKVEDALLETIMTGKADWSSLVQYILSESLKLLVIKPLMQSLMGSGIGGLGNGLFGGFFAQGGAFNNGVQFFARGGIVSSTTPFQLSQNTLGVMGEAGPEAIVPLARMNNGDLGIQMLNVPQPPINISMTPQLLMQQPTLSNAQPITVTVINNGQAMQADVQQQRRSDGGMDITVMMDTIEQSMAQRMAKGGSLQNATAGAFNLNKSAGGYR